MAYQLKHIELAAIIVIFACLMSPSVWADEQPLKILAVHFPPYEFESPVNGLKGFDVEVVETVFQRMGAPAKVEFLPWIRAVEIVYAGQAMALLSCGHTKGRDVHVFYSDVISTATHGYFQRKEDPDLNYHSLVELQGQKIAAVRGYTVQKKLEELDIEHIKSRNDKLALNILIGKRVDIYYGTKESNEFIANQMGIAKEIKFHPFNTKSYHMCFSKKWPGSKELLAKFNDGLAQLKADGDYKKIHDKYR